MRIMIVVIVLFAAVFLGVHSVDAALSCIGPMDLQNTRYSARCPPALVTSVARRVVLLAYTFYSLLIIFL